MLPPKLTIREEHPALSFRYSRDAAIDSAPNLPRSRVCFDNNPAPDQDRSQVSQALPQGIHSSSKFLTMKLS
jgi:hypothetical protein